MPLINGRWVPSAAPGLGETPEQAQARAERQRGTVSGGDIIQPDVQPVQTRRSAGSLWGPVAAQDIPAAEPSAPARTPFARVSFPSGDVVEGSPEDVYRALPSAMRPRVAPGAPKPATGQPEPLAAMPDAAPAAQPPAAPPRDPEAINAEAEARVRPVAVARAEDAFRAKVMNTANRAGFGRDVATAAASVMTAVKSGDLSGLTRESVKKLDMLLEQKPIDTAGRDAWREMRNARATLSAMLASEAKQMDAAIEQAAPQTQAEYLRLMNQASQGGISPATIARYIEQKPKAVSETLAKNAQASRQAMIKEKDRIEEEERQAARKKEEGIAKEEYELTPEFMAMGVSGELIGAAFEALRQGDPQPLQELKAERITAEDAKKTAASREAGAANAARQSVPYGTDEGVEMLGQLKAKFGLSVQDAALAGAGVEAVPLTPDVQFKARANSIMSGALELVSRLAEDPDADPKVLAAQVVADMEKGDAATVTGDEATGRRYLASEILREAKRGAESRVKEAQGKAAAEIERQMETAGAAASAFTVVSPETAYSLVSDPANKDKSALQIVKELWMADIAASPLPEEAKEILANAVAASEGRDAAVAGEKNEVVKFLSRLTASAQMVAVAQRADQVRAERARIEAELRRAEITKQAIASQRIVVFYTDDKGVEQPMFFRQNIQSEIDAAVAFKNGRITPEQVRQVQSQTEVSERELANLSGLLDKGYGWERALFKEGDTFYEDQPIVGTRNTLSEMDAIDKDAAIRNMIDTVGSPRSRLVQEHSLELEARLREMLAENMEAVKAEGEAEIAAAKEAAAITKPAHFKPEEFTPDEIQNANDFLRRHINDPKAHKVARGLIRAGKLDDATRDAVMIALQKAGTIKSGTPLAQLQAVMISTGASKL